jgi:hypothetical protein
MAPPLLVAGNPGVWAQADHANATMVSHCGFDSATMMSHGGLDGTTMMSHGGCDGATVMSHAWWL